MWKRASPSTATVPTHDISMALVPLPPDTMTYDTTLPYPRDLIGYGRNPPHAQWPGGARIAVQFVLNYEEGGENAVLHGDAGSEQFLSEMFNPASLPRAAHEHGRHLRVRLARRRVAHPARVRKARPAADGVWRQHGAAAPPRADRKPSWSWATRSPATAWRWIHYQTWTRPPSAPTCAWAWRSSASLTGERPLGWYTGRDSPNTRRLVADYGGFEYDSDYYGDDLPFWMKVQKTDGTAVPQLIVPYTLDCNDMRFALPQGYSHADPFFHLPARTASTRCTPRRPAGDNAQDDEHRHALPPAGRPGRITALQRFLDHIASTTASGCAAASTSPATGNNPPLTAWRAEPEHGTHPEQLNAAAARGRRSCSTACTSIPPGLRRPRWRSGPFGRWRTQARDGRVVARRRPPRRSWR
jgi:allantoinase